MTGHHASDLAEINELFAGRTVESVAIDYDASGSPRHLRFKFAGDGGALVSIGSQDDGVWLEWEPRDPSARVGPAPSEPPSYVVVARPPHTADGLVLIARKGPYIGDGAEVRAIIAIEAYQLAEEGRLDGWAGSGA